MTAAVIVLCLCAWMLAAGGVVVAVCLRSSQFSRGHDAPTDSGPAA